MWDAFSTFVDANPRLVKVAGLAVIMAEVAALGAACWLHSIYQAAYDDWLDGVEERRARVREVLSRSAERVYGVEPGAAASPWGRRLRGKYGVGSSEWEESARAVRQAALMADDAAAAPA